MPAKLIGDRAMTAAERQARYRAARVAEKPIVKTRRPKDHRSRAQRWLDTVAELVTLQQEYVAWRESLPASLEGGATAEALDAICALDLGELEAIVPPRGYGRD